MASDIRHSGGKSLSRRDVERRQREEEHNGEIQLITGPMFAGKSTELIRRVRRYEVAKLRCFTMRPFADKRTDPAFVYAHDGVTKISCSGVFTSLSEFIETRFKEGWDVVAIDEGHFLPDLFEGCKHMANAGCTVIVAALDSTSEGQPFGETIFLMLEAEYVTKLLAICASCQGDAAFSALRKDAHKQHGQIILVEGAESYYAVCRSCRPPPVAKWTPADPASPRVNHDPVPLPMMSDFHFLPEERWRYADDVEFPHGDDDDDDDDLSENDSDIMDESGHTGLAPMGSITTGDDGTDCY